MEQNLNLILPEITAITPSPTGGNVLRMDDPELMKFPIAYLSEPGYWYPSDGEVEGLRTYLAKGGFLIVDDFHFAQERNVFEDRALERSVQVRDQLPDVRNDAVDRLADFKTSPRYFRPRRSRAD